DEESSTDPAGEAPHEPGTPTLSGQNLAVTSARKVDEEVPSDPADAGPEHETEPDLEPDLNATIAPGPRSAPSDAESEQSRAATGETTQVQPSTETDDDEDGAEDDDETQSHSETGTDADDVDDRTIAGPPASPSAVETPDDRRSRPSSAVPGPQELIDSVPWLAAARKTVPARAPEPAASEMVEVLADLGMTVAPEQSPDDHSDGRSGGHPHGDSGAPSDARAGAATNAQDADDADTVMSPSAPGPAPSPAPLPAPPASPAKPASGSGGTAAVEEDHDGETVMKSDLGLPDLPSSEPAPAPAPPPATGPVVLARQCSQGHANPPTNATCGVCGQSLSGEAQQLRRPSLGRLRMSTGEVVELDRPAVIGRQPQAHRVGSGTMPRMIQVRSPNGDISRSHCEVVLEGWHVQLRDLKATNGTVLIREGQAPRRLGQGESLMVLDGDIADLGDGISVRFEGLL
ncbi:FHA domain-containing protein, partial [Citricoccus sp.]|uniref:FHA domain-containing protein n=1 Tax=Citricoccus sp. TaxID=1978372 RepID=UPI0028BE6EC3